MSNPRDSNPKISVGKNYKLIKKIGKGSFGEVYLATDKEGGEYAFKIESNSARNRLKGESLIYKRFAIKNLECVPKVYRYMETPEYNLLIMQLLGKSLDVVFDECGGKIDIGTVMKLGVTIISHLEKIHRVGIIHRDIKPNNFMFGIGENSNDLYIMDFGLSKRWYVEGNHIEFKVGRSMIGTARYASLNIHNGTEPSRRDDMESVGYMLVYLAKGSLPWQGLKKKTKENPMDKIGDKKMMVDLKELCEGLPDCFYEYINYTRNLQFTEKPDYDYLREIFITSAQNENIKLKYFWEKDEHGDAIPKPTSQKSTANTVTGGTKQQTKQSQTSPRTLTQPKKAPAVRRVKKDDISGDNVKKQPVPNQLTQKRSQPGRLPATTTKQIKKNDLDENSNSDSDANEVDTGRVIVEVEKIVESIESDSDNKVQKNKPVRRVQRRAAPAKSRVVKRTGQQ